MKRAEKAILNNIERLVKKYSLIRVKRVSNRFFNLQRAKFNAERELKEKEKEIAILKRKLVQ